MEFEGCLYLEDGEEEFCVTVDVTEDENEILKDCCREEEEIVGHDGLEELTGRIVSAALDSMEELHEDEMESLSYDIYMPEEITEEIESEQEIDQYDYCDYPFAMEVVNGNIISMTKDFQVEVREKIMKKLQMSEKELASYLIKVYYDEESPEEKYDLLNDYPENFFSSILGLDYEEGDFSPEGIGFYDSGCGWNAAELLSGLGYVLSENINDGAHGHDTNGVMFYSK